MRHSKVYRRPDGSRCELAVSLSTSGYDSRCHFQVSLGVCPAGKRKFVSVAPEFSDSWEYRRLSSEQQQAFRRARILEYVTPGELQEVMSELLERIKVNFNLSWCDGEVKVSQD